MQWESTEKILDTVNSGQGIRGIPFWIPIILLQCMMHNKRLLIQKSMGKDNPKLLIFRSEFSGP